MQRLPPSLTVGLTAPYRIALIIPAVASRHRLPAGPLARGRCDRAGSDDRFGEALHLFELRAALQ